MRKLLIAAAIAAALGICAPAHAVDMLQDGSNATLPSAQDNLGVMRNVKAYGAKCDNSTNDTAAIQAAIDANANGSIALPVGFCIANGLILNKPIRIAGAGNRSSVLVSPLGATNPVLSVQLDTNSGLGGGGAVQLSDFRITSKSRSDPPGLNAVHGIKLASVGGVTSQTTLTHVSMDQLPGSCLYGDGAGVTVLGYTFACSQPSQYAIYMNSTSDWSFFGGGIWGAGIHNILCSGCGYTHFYQMQNFSAVQNGIRLFNSNNFYWNGGSLDRNGYHNVSIDNRTGAPAYFADVTIGYAGKTTDLTYSDMELTALNTGPVHLTNVVFYDKATSPSPGKPLDNIHINSGNAGYIYGKGMTFDAGNWLTAGVLGGTTRFYRGTEANAAWTPTLIGSAGGTATMSQQIGNYTVDGGVVQLFGSIVASSLSSLTGTLKIGGLPVPPIAVAYNPGSCSFASYQGWTTPAGTWNNISGQIAGTSNPTTIIINRNATNGSVSTASDVTEWGSNTNMNFTCVYRY